MVGRRGWCGEEGSKQRDPLSLTGRLQFDPQSPPSKYSKDDGGGGGGKWQGRGEEDEKSGSV